MDWEPKRRGGAPLSRFLTSVKPRCYSEEQDKETFRWANTIEFYPSDSKQYNADETGTVEIYYEIQIHNGTHFCFVKYSKILIRNSSLAFSKFLPALYSQKRQSINTNHFFYNTNHSLVPSLFLPLLSVLYSCLPSVSFFSPTIFFFSLIDHLCTNLI